MAGHKTYKEINIYFIDGSFMAFEDADSVELSYSIYDKTESGITVHKWKQGNDTAINVYHFPYTNVKYVELIL